MAPKAFHALVSFLQRVPQAVLATRHQLETTIQYAGLSPFSVTCSMQGTTVRQCPACMGKYGAHEAESDKGVDCKAFRHGYAVMLDAHTAADKLAGAAQAM